MGRKKAGARECETEGRGESGPGLPPSLQTASVLGVPTQSQAAYNSARDFTSACTEPRDWPEAKHFTGLFSECDPALALDVAFKTPQ